MGITCAKGSEENLPIYPGNSVLPYRIYCPPLARIICPELGYYVRGLEENVRLPDPILAKSRPQTAFFRFCLVTAEKRSGGSP